MIVYLLTYCIYKFITYLVMENLNEGDKYFIFPDKNEEEAILKIKQLTKEDAKLSDQFKKYCSLHNVIKATCELCEITTCFKCLFSSKDMVDHYYNHFDKISKDFNIVKLKDYVDPMKTFEK